MPSDGPSGARAVDRDVHALRSGRGCRPASRCPPREWRPARSRSPNGYCQAARSAPRNGMVSSSICGSWAAQSGWMLAVAPSRRKRGTSAGWTTCRCARWGRLSRGPFGRRAASTASSASRTARSPSAWKCTWKPCRVQLGDVLAQAAGSTKEMPALSDGAAAASSTGSSMAAVKFSAMPSCMILTLRRRGAARRSARPGAR